MLEEHDPSKPKASEIASRRWRNNQAIKRLREEKQKPQLVDPDAKPEPSDVITNEGRRDGPLNRFESKFKQEIRQMMEGHVKKNLAIYAAALEHRKRILLKEKIRRAKLAQQQAESNREVGK